ncbi:MAG: hypothetical protein A3C90_03240 [Candidatus Magasanikbacteria bacterium RIFCSPHIGHO2_02_FULL_51_14]|uniref:Uncharacterized protein n=1 Tax=Candidatus Magasanikbacteria bacterium RIFCSPHIGHO2_02_FULL_51_14 TaxID=1798683 RepID=A0A1F6MFQ8_9BACT|nr:MAG: hypothetical protein A3C90_03240 [Candidatus Magasanikbacteria bacterium RIFCSPHIGHO2_02_FULL_51_14]
MNQQQQWAVALKKSKNNSAQAARVSSPVVKKHIEDAIAYYKKELRSAASAKRTERIPSIVKQLIGLRARQAAAAISESKNQKETDRTLTNYYIDCYRLVNAANQLVTP